MAIDDKNHHESSLMCIEYDGNNGGVKEPGHGMEFSSVEFAYNSYLRYASRMGFNVRKHHQKKNKDGSLTRVSFCCSNQGFRKADKGVKGATFRKPVSRMGCLAEMSCLLVKNGNYKVVSFNVDHNHDLVPTPMKHMLKVNRSISTAQKARCDEVDKVGISIKATVDLMSKEVGGREQLGFMDKDYRNYIYRKRKMAMEKGDAGAILEYFQKMQCENSSYFYSIQLDEDDMITNIFWADARGVSDYALFGDVVCFDTTYRTNEYGRPFAPFVGVNHHKQTIVFGAALLYDETIESFTWLFETFLNAMSGKKPKTILTDQCAAMANSIAKVFTHTCHRLCVWHIYQNAAKHLSHVFSRSKEFTRDFNKCMYDYEDEQDWLMAWEFMLEEYGLKENSWLKAQFMIREKWAVVYGRDTFTADMKSTQRSESMNSVLKNYLKPRHDLLHFFNHYERLLEDRRYEELRADYKMMHTKPVMYTSAEMLCHGAEVYTPEVFNLFQEEFLKVLNYNCDKVSKDGTTYIYKVWYAGTTKVHKVTFESETQATTCSCKKFNFAGILCVHSLKVLDKKNVKKIPDQYIEKRWTSDAKVRHIANYDGYVVNGSPKESVGKRYSNLCRNFRELASCASENERLYAYAHTRLIDLLKDLEEMKKNVESEGMIVEIDPSDRDENLVHASVNNENACSLYDIATKAIGIKRKATVGRPKGRIKDPLEIKKRPKVSKTKLVEIKEHTRNDVRTYFLTQEQMSYNNDDFNNVGSLSFTQLLTVSSEFPFDN